MNIFLYAPVLLGTTFLTYFSWGFNRRTVSTSLRMFCLWGLCGIFPHNDAAISYRKIVTINVWPYFFLLYFRLILSFKGFHWLLNTLYWWLWVFWRFFRIIRGSFWFDTLQVIQGAPWRVLRAVCRVYRTDSPRCRVKCPHILRLLPILCCLDKEVYLRDELGLPGHYFDSLQLIVETCWEVALHQLLYKQLRLIFSLLSKLFYVSIRVASLSWTRTEW